jgi:dephospho-CoA kinase
MRAEIILIGPIWTGKSTIAELLSQRLGIRRASMDDSSWRYYEEVGFDPALGSELESHTRSSGTWRITRGV